MIINAIRKLINMKIFPKDDAGVTREVECKLAHLA